MYEGRKLPKQNRPKFRAPESAARSPTEESYCSALFYRAICSQNVMALHYKPPTAPLDLP
jgi:hypothetical protein